MFVTGFECDGCHSIVARASVDGATLRLFDELVAAGWDMGMVETPDGPSLHHCSACKARKKREEDVCKLALSE